jgi:hypothetical protein
MCHQVRLDSLENLNRTGISIAGATTVAAEGGVAAFLNTRMRAPEGPRLLVLNATIDRPLRRIAGPRVRRGWG